MKVSTTTTTTSTMVLLLSLGTLLLLQLGGTVAATDTPTLEDQHTVNLWQSNDSDGSEHQQQRELDAVDCPADKPDLVDRYFRIFFHIETSSDTVSCPKIELKRMGYALPKEFDRFLEKMSTKLFDPTEQVGGINIDMCLRNKELNQGGDIVKHRALLRGITEDMAGELNENEAGLSQVRRLTAQDDDGTDIFLFRGIGTVSLCTKKGNDKGAKNSLDSASMVYFTRILGYMKDQLDVELTKKILERVPKNKLPCLKGIGLRIRTTVVPLEKEPKKSCSRDECCANPFAPQGGCDNTYHPTRLCHSSEKTCTKECGGLWVDPYKPPKCLGMLKTCEPKKDRCCPGTECKIEEDEAVCVKKTK